MYLNLVLPRLNFNRNALRLTKSVAVLATGLGAIGVYQMCTPRIEMESPIKPIEGVDPIPRSIDLDTSFDLLGYGVRHVSFLKFKVYLLGVYLAREDESLLKKIFNSKYLESFYEDEVDNGENASRDHKTNLEHALRDPKTSNLLIGNAINGGVKFSARICALRNTDLGHLRDGFIRTITNSSKYKELKGSEDKTIPERLDLGVEELRRIFNESLTSAKKNSLLYMEMKSGGEMQITLELFNGKTHLQRRVLGTVKEPLVSLVLFESYLGGDRPLVEEVHQRSVSQLLSLF